MKYLQKLETGLQVTNIVFLTVVLIRLVMSYGVPSLSRLVMTIIVILLLAYSTGEVIDRLESIYLKGQYISSGNWTVEKE